MSEAMGSDDGKNAKPDGDAPTGTSLSPAAEGPSGVDPFLASVGETREVPEPRPFYAKALDYSAHAAMIVGLVGFAWTVSGHVINRQPTASAAKPVKIAEAASATATPATMAAAATTASITTASITTPATTTPAAPAASPVETPKVDEIGDLRRANQKMAAEIRNLHASLEALRTTVVRERTSSPDDVRSLSTTLDSMKSSLASVKSEQAAVVAQLTAKIEKLQRGERQQTIAEHAARPDRQPVDTTTTASIPSPIVAKPIPTPPAKPTVLASTAPYEGRADRVRSEQSKSEPAKFDQGKFDQGKFDQGKSDQSQADQGKPQVIAGWVVRDVYEGVALVEGRRGQMEVVPGVSIPGAGVVKSIDRHGGGWTVTTTKGQLAYAAPQRELRRTPMRDYYGPRRFDDF